MRGPTSSLLSFSCCPLVVGWWNVGWSLEFGWWVGVWGVGGSVGVWSVENDVWTVVLGGGVLGVWNVKCLGYRV